MPKSVLVVDDNAFIRQVLCRVLASEAGFDVCGEAGNGQDAIEKAQALHPDLILHRLRRSEKAHPCACHSEFPPKSGRC